MRIVCETTLNGFARRYADAKAPLRAWVTKIKSRPYKHLSDIKEVFPSADLVGKTTVFNIAGNKYRLITAIHYNTQIIYILEVMTHAEYSKKDWQKRYSVFD